ncbi:MAG: hypothetical protein JWQ09_332, partial [Segetibacter sp.]|nr:hypothetical protein [Segetibacter sp.]
MGEEKSDSLDGAKCISYEDGRER